jgi:hypothetical protein
MPKFVYTGEAGRYYPSLGLAPVPDQVYDLDAAPDGRWKAAQAAPAPSMQQSAPNAPERI